MNFAYHYCPHPCIPHYDSPSLVFPTLSLPLLGLLFHCLFLPLCFFLSYPSCTFSFLCIFVIHGYAVGRGDTCFLSTDKMKSTEVQTLDAYCISCVQCACAEIGHTLHACVLLLHCRVCAPPPPGLVRTIRMCTIYN